MNRSVRFFLVLGLLLNWFPLLSPAATRAQEPAQIALPKPDITGGAPLMEALSRRQSSRQFGAKPVSEQELGNLLWATWGVNRPDGRHTAPTARNSQAVAVYVVLENGVWLYDSARHALIRQLATNERSRYGNAPVTLLYAAPEKDEFGGMHVGSLYQNAGLYCASAGLANVVRINGVNALKGILSLPAGYRILITQSLGWPE
jgi:hypothetical protein